MPMPTEAATPTPFTLAGPNGPLHGLIDFPAEPGLWPTVVICHGFKGFMEWAFFPYLAHLLSERGLVAVRFNLSGSGQQPGEDRVSDLDAFRSNTQSRELADLLAVIAAVGGEIAPGRADAKRISLVGHSRGGGNAILAAARPELRERVRALVTWAAVATFDRFSEDQKAFWREIGEFPMQNTRTKQNLSLGLGLLEDLEANGEALDPIRAAAARSCPWLIVHGDRDDSVGFSDGEKLKAAAAEPCELLRIEGGDHGFGAKHPFQGPTPQLIEAMNATRRWLGRWGQTR
ncbi:MAG TPA: alpha/beta fold hydrolase [Thermoanaerobaculia bacterium]|nr:alpha/beta fold hydrolase [Thermoanaerobaculia bacterium]